jgi:hypothetical protein
VNRTNLKSFLLGAATATLLGLFAILINQRGAHTGPEAEVPPSPAQTNSASASVPVSEYNKLVEAENRLALVVSNLQSIVALQQDEVTSLHAKTAEQEQRAGEQENRSHALNEICVAFQANSSQMLTRVTALQQAVIKLSLGVQSLQSNTNRPP